MREHGRNTTCLRVGITGGIGSGKTTVCSIFETLGIPVYNADYWARWLITNDPELRQAISSLFGADAYLPDSTYNRGYVAGIVFREPAKLAALNAAVHPAVERHSLAWHLDHAQTGVPYTLKEAALLIESGSHHHLDQLIVVTAPENLRIQRVVERDKISADAVRARIKSQLPESEKERLADFVIRNDGEHSLVQQVFAVHQALVRI